MPPTASIGQPAAATPALLDSLQGIRRKVKTLSVLYGVGIVVAVAVLSLLAVVLLDYLFNLKTGPRVFFIAAAVCAIVYALWRFIVTPVAARFTLNDVAGRLETAFPQFDDRLRSTVDFVRGDIPGSSVMKDRVVTEAGRMAASVNLNNAIAAKPVVQSLGLALAAVALVAIIALANLDFARIAFSRLLIVNPQAWPKKVNIEVLKALPAKVAAGQRLDLRMRLTKGDKASMKPIVYYKYDNGDVQRQIMARNADGTYGVALDAKGGAMSVWMRAGDDETTPANVAVVQRLAIRSVNAKISPPAYAKLAPTTANLSETPAYMTAGSSVELQILFNKPLAEDKPVTLESVKPDAPMPQIHWHNAEQALAVGTWTAEQSLRFRVKATDRDYFENPGLEEFELIVRPDQTPSVIIENPRRPEDRTPVAVVHLEALAEDDFDISSMTLVVDRVGDKKHWEIPLEGWSRTDSSGDRQRFRVKYDWELNQLKDAELKPGDVLEYYLRVTDNYNINGALHEPVMSGKLKINIISQETLAQQVTDAIRTVAEKVRQAQNTQNRNKTETQGLREQTKDKPQMDRGDQTALARLTDQQSAIASMTKQLAGQMEDIERRLDENRSDNVELKDIAKAVEQTLNQTAENQMSDASKRLAEASLRNDQKNAGERNKSIEGSEQKQQEAADELGKALEKMGNLGTFEQMLQAVRDALARQQELSKQLKDLGKETIGKKAEDLTAEQKKKLDEIADAQKKESEKTEKMTQDLNKAAQQMQKQDSASAGAMKQAAQQAQQQKVSGSQSQASQSAQQNQQAQAQAKQKQAELGLQMMLDTMREAQRKKLEQLAKELAKLQELIANLVRRQAGHNIDNLLNQGGEKVQLVTDELAAKAERAKENMPPKPEVPQLSNFQGQTERNTRDVSKTAEEMQKGGSEIAGMLIKAAGLMERAVVSLKETRLPEAYDPSQVRALATLEDAKTKTDEMLAEIQKQMDDANKDTVRQAYEKIKAEQEEINTETAKIDSSPRLPDGTLKREDAVRLNKLPPREGALAQRTNELEEALSALGGIVYVWANKDIVDSMTEVKTDLAKPETGKPTQAEQKRIVEQLDAMIRNLAVKPLQKEFENPQGGGGGACKPGLPSEAELRLLKELQIAINRSTKTIDAEPNPDKPKLVGLGNRQGELRDLLNQLLEKSSQGQIKLDAEPDPKDKLPEEAKVEDIENQELEDWLKGAKSSDDQLADDMKLVGARMARSRQRLALDNDPGKTTQAIQERILHNLDNLIELARQQEAQAKPGQGQGQKPGQAQKPQQASGVKPQNEGGQSKPNQGTSPAGSETLSGGGNNSADLSKDIRERDSEWGHLTPRERAAIIEGVGDRIIGKYKKITDDYYEMLSKKGSEQR
jgi:hypothetical protein